MKLKKNVKNVCVVISVLGLIFMFLFPIYDGLGGYSTPHREIISVGVLIPTFICFWLSTHF